jgi:serine/threonine protein kinase
MEYMHTGCTPAIVHRDLKTDNILLDDMLRAKIADFGLSKSVADRQVSEGGRGTIGYLDP